VTALHDQPGSDVDAQPIEILDIAPRNGEFLHETLAGLSRSPKELPCKYFYDERGSALFDAICELPEYYLTRTENAIMEGHGIQMAKLCGSFAALIELGSGSSSKTRILLQHLVDPAAYVPIDISREHLMTAAMSLRESYPSLRILPVCADYTRLLVLPDLPPETERRVMYFPGSTVGNLSPEEAFRFLKRLAALAGEGGGLLIGIALKCDRHKMEAAYNDAAGVTAAFNFNILVRINRELEGDFDLAKFRHRASYNDEMSRIEMHLESLADQKVTIGDREFAIAKGESIRTECSYKYHIEEFERMAIDAGFEIEKVWPDPDGSFAVAFLSVGP
jgi:dimethylhistidine N-methyltransferase